MCSLTLPFAVHYEQLFKACHFKHQGDGPTGILLVYPQHCLHLVEAPMEILTATISDLRDMNASGSVGYYSIHTVSIIHGMHEQ